MTYFKLDIPKLNDQISRYRQSKKDCLDDIGIVYRGLGYTESAWNDSNAYSFIEKSKMDKYKLIEYFGYLDSIYGEINQFKTDIDNICHKYGYRNNSITLKFDDSEINECKKKLNNVINYLNICLNNININLFKPDFKYLNLVYTLRTEIKSIKVSVNNLLTDITNFTNSVNSELSDSRFRMKRISKYSFNIKIPEYKWKTQSMQVNYTNSQNINEYSSVQKENINFKSNNENTNLSTNYNIASASDIDLKETKNNKTYINTTVDNVIKENNVGFEQDNDVFINSNFDAVEHENSIGFKQNNNAFINNSVDRVAEDNNISSIENDNINLNVNNYDTKETNINLTENQNQNFNASQYEYSNINNANINYQTNTNEVKVDNIVENINQEKIDTSNISSNQFSFNDIPKYDSINNNKINIDNN